MRYVLLLSAMSGGLGCAEGKRAGDVPCDTATACDNCCVEESVEDPDEEGHFYQYADLYDASNDNGSNWTSIDGRPVVVTLHVDRDSVMQFVYLHYYETLLTSSEADAAIDEAMTYWNSAGAGVALKASPDDKNCCNSAAEVECVDCFNNAESDFFFWDGLAEDVQVAWTGYAGVTRPTANGFCLESKDVVLFSTVTEDDGKGCEVHWLYPFTNNKTECDGGVKEKAFKDTIIHELGHVLGLGGDFDPWPESAVSYDCDYASGCSYDEVGEIDALALQELYDQCDV